MAKIPVTIPNYRNGARFGVDWQTPTYQGMNEIYESITDNEDLAEATHNKIDKISAGATALPVGQPPTAQMLPTLNPQGGKQLQLGMPAPNEIQSTVITYQVGNSGTTIPTGTWVNTVQATNTGQFLWTRTVITLTNGATQTSYSVAAHGSTGLTGDTGLTPDITVQAHTLNPGLNATVTRSGTNENPHLDFGIPRGDKGEQGVQGVPGADATIITYDFFLGLEQDESYEQGGYTLTPINVLGSSVSTWSVAFEDDDGYTKNTITIGGL